MKAKALNPQVLLELICCGLFGALMLYLALSGKYLSYVTPRMKPYLYFVAAVMLLWVCTGCFRLFRLQYKARAAHCFVLVIPVLLLLLPHGTPSAANLSGSASAFDGQTVAGPLPIGTNLLPATSSPVESAAPAKLQSAAPEEADGVNLPGLDVENQKITVSDENFSRWLSEFYGNMEQYEGYTVVMTGSVYHNSETLKDDEFVPARLMMSCCVADLSPTGLVCKYDKASELEQDAWVTVEGTLFVGTYEYDGQQYEDPEIDVTKVTPAQAVEGYVYPYY